MNIKNIHGFYYNFSSEGLFGNKKQKFHYILNLNNKLEIPGVYDDRNGYSFRVGKKWYYERKIVGGYSFKFCFDEEQKIFHFNSLYLYFPIQIGLILPLGKMIADIINVQLSQEGYYTFLGSAFRKDSKMTVILSPSCNGKTTYMNALSRDGVEIIADDLVILDLQSKKIFFSLPAFSNYGRKSNTQLKKNYIKGLSSNLYFEGINFDEIGIFLNSTGNHNRAKRKVDLYTISILLGLAFLYNPLARLYIYQMKIDFISQLKNSGIQIDEYSIKNFNFNN